MANAPKEKDDTKRPIFIIKKIKKGGGHHGGAWKVAYADFVTAMMAFFLLMWLLSVTTKEQKEGISDFFDPTPQVSQNVSGAGGMLGGASLSTDGVRSTDLSNNIPNPAISNPTKGGVAGEPNLEQIEKEKLEQEIERREEKEFENVKKNLEAAMNASPEMKEMLKNLVIDMTPEGLRIQIIDQEGASMFASGSAQMYEKTQKLLDVVGKVIQSVPNQVSIRGHTDGVQYKGEDPNYTNWELSSDRANASRMELMRSGIPVTRIANVVGKADTDHFVKENPLDPRNRRLSIILLHDKQTKSTGANASTTPKKPQGPKTNSAGDLTPETIGGGTSTDLSPYESTPGSVQFP